MRARTPICVKARVRDGSVIERSHPTGSRVSGTKPPVGSQCSCTPKNTIRSSPNQKSGTDKPSRATEVAAWSIQVLCRTAARMPSSMPITTDSNSPSATSERVTGSRSITAAATERFSR